MAGCALKVGEALSQASPSPRPLPVCHCFTRLLTWLLAWEEPLAETQCGGTRYSASLLGGVAVWAHSLSKVAACVQQFGRAVHWGLLVVIFGLGLVG